MRAKRGEAQGWLNMSVGYDGVSAPHVWNIKTGQKWSWLSYGVSG